MNLRGTWLLTKTNNRHLCATTFDRPFKTGVGLNAIHRQNSISSGGKTIKINRHPTGRTRDFECFHRGANLSTDGFWRHAERGQHFNLPVGGAATVAPHRRHNKWLGSKFA